MGANDATLATSVLQNLSFIFLLVTFVFGTLIIKNVALSSDPGYGKKQVVGIAAGVSLLIVGVSLLLMTAPIIGLGGGAPYRGGLFAVGCAATLAGVFVWTLSRLSVKDRRKHVEAMNQMLSQAHSPSHGSQPSEEQAAVGQ